MATPMEYDTLREIYSSAMAVLTRLEMQSASIRHNLKKPKTTLSRYG